MNDIGFYLLEVGSIGTIQYKVSLTNVMSDAEKQMHVDKASNERMRKFINDAMFGNTSLDPTDAFVKARRESWGDIENGDIMHDIKSVAIQIGQEESKDLINKIESMDDFIAWMDPELVSIIKQI